MKTDFRQLLQTLSAHQVEFILVEGLAAIAHGSARLTFDLDVVYARSDENLTRIVDALRPFSPYPRGAPKGLPFKWDQRALRIGLNFTLETQMGYIDLLGEITGGGDYRALLPYTFSAQLYGYDCLCLSLDKLIHVKRAAGRPKDFEAVAELEALLEEQRQQDRDQPKFKLNKQEI